jgi:UDP-4-amino-4,6-dideoxy-N-acetyl-beta-L-altrosamine N-acetyltransferase
MLNLIPATIEDTDFILELHNNPDIKTSFISRKDPITQEQHLQFMKKLAQKGDLYFIIYEDTNRIGTISIYDIDKENNCAEWGRFLIKKEYPGRGAESLQLLIDKAFKGLKLHKLYCTVISHNTRTIKLYEKCGFEIEGILKERIFQDNIYHDLIFMGITNPEVSKNVL